MVNEDILVPIVSYIILLPKNGLHSNVCLSTLILKKDTFELQSYTLVLVLVLIAVLCAFELKNR